jgi:hypothetical protein
MVCWQAMRTERLERDERAENTSPEGPASSRVLASLENHCCRFFTCRKLGWPFFKLMMPNPPSASLAAAFIWTTSSPIAPVQIWWAEQLRAAPVVGCLFKIEQFFKSPKAMLCGLDSQGGAV